jgi:hypothetical protein
MYDKNIINFFDVYSVGENGDAIQFERVINLIGINGELVAIKATFDDGATVNVIDMAAFEEVKNRLSELQPLKKVMRMVNGVLIPSNGSWSGVVVIGNVQTTRTFEIFASGGVWNILFGKPMLQAFNAIHKYTTNTITLHSSDSKSTLVIQNENPDKLPLAKSLQKPKVAVVQVSNMGEHDFASPLRPREVHSHVAHVSIDHPLNIAEVNKLVNPRENLGRPPRQTASFYYSIQEEQAARSQKANYKWKIQVQRRKEHKLKLKVLHEEWDRLEMLGKLGRYRFDKMLRNTKAARECKERRDLRVWNRTPWDFGEPSKPGHQESDLTEEVNSEVAQVISDQNGDCRARVEDCPDESLEAEGL